MKLFFFLAIVLAVRAELWAIQLNEPEEQARLTVEAQGYTYVKPLAHLPGYHIVDDRGVHAEKLQADPVFTWRARMVKRRQHKRNSYNDPYYWVQWHLRDAATGVGMEDTQHGEGKGVTVAIVDDGLQHIHADLHGNYRADLSYDYNDNDNDPSPSFYDGHGTSAAGVCCAVANSACGVGVAPKADLVGIRLIAAGTYDYEEAEGLSHKRDSIRIYSNSWGPQDSGLHLSGPGRLTEETLKDSAENYNSIYVWAAGNGRANRDNCNYDGYANSMYTIAIGALGHDGRVSWYSEPGAMLMAVTPSNGARGYGITTTDLLGRYGYAPGDCTSTFGGTSSAAPLAAGMIALVLGERPDLTWRDVQHVVAKAALPVDVAVANARGYQFSHDYGFGRLRVPELLGAARDHQLVPPRKTCERSNRVVRARLTATETEHVTGCTIQFIEHVELIVKTTGVPVGELTITLESPEGHTSVLAEPHGDTNTMMHWTFRSVRHWGEQHSNGNWKVHVDATRGTLYSYQLSVHGF